MSGDCAAFDACPEVGWEGSEPAGSGSLLAVLAQRAHAQKHTKRKTCQRRKSLMSVILLPALLCSYSSRCETGQRLPAWETSERLAAGANPPGHCSAGPR